jgi:hypothetical protein
MSIPGILSRLPWEVWLWIFEDLDLPEGVRFLATHHDGQTALIQKYLPELFPGLPSWESPSVSWLLNHGYPISNLRRYFAFDQPRTRRTPEFLRWLTNSLKTPLDFCTWTFLARADKSVVDRAVVLVGLGFPCDHLEYLKTELLNESQFQLITRLIQLQFTYLDLIELKSRNLQMSGKLYSYLTDLIRSGKSLKSTVQNLGFHSRPVDYSNKPRLL